jgi:hypothetical protein
MAILRGEIGVKRGVKKTSRNMFGGAAMSRDAIAMEYTMIAVRIAAMVLAILIGVAISSTRFNERAKRD